MTSPISTTEDTKKKFVPKRRAPYLLQDEIIQQKLNEDKQNASQTNQELKTTPQEKPIEKEAKPKKTTKVKQYSKTKTQPKEKVVNKESLSSLEPSVYKGSHLVVSDTLNYHEEVSKLYGIQKRIAHYFVQCCLARRELTTGPVTAETLCGVANTTKKTLKKIIQRMIEKALIVRVDGKRGKGGFSVFSLEQGFIDVVRLQLDLENTHLNIVQSADNQKMPTTQKGKILPEEWGNIDFIALEEIGFGEPQIRQIYSKNVTDPTTLQTSINHFAFALKHNPDSLKKYNNKLATLMGVIMSGGAWVEKDYMSPQEIAFQKVAEQKKARIAKMKKLEEDCLSDEFELWVSNLTPQEREDLIPDDVKKAPFAKDTQKTLALKSYFKANLWEERMPEELKQVKKDLAE